MAVQTTFQTCMRCGHTWNHTDVSLQDTCPNCGESPINDAVEREIRARARRASVEFWANSPLIAALAQDREENTAMDKNSTAYEKLKDRVNTDGLRGMIGVDMAAKSMPRPTNPIRKVTAAEIDQRIANVDYTVLPGTTVTICSITLDNGYSVRGESACVDARAYNKALGEKIAYQKAFDKLWGLFGFLLAEDGHRAKTLPNDADVAVNIYIRRPRDLGVVGDSGFIVATTTYPAAPGEFHQRGNDLKDGPHSEATVDRIGEALMGVYLGELG